MPCWPFAWRLARFRCAGGIITPAAPVALNIRPFSVPCVKCLYKHQPRQCWRRPCWPCVAVSRPCVAFAWLAGRARAYHHTAAGLYPRAAGVARCPHLRPVLAVFRRFGGRFGVAVVSNAGAVSLRPFRWCRCACKVAAPVWPCFRPCSLQMVSRASLAAVSCPIICTPSDISPHQSQREQYPATRARRAFTCAAPALYTLAGGLLVLPAGLAGLAGGCLVAIAPCQLLAALLLRWRRIIIRQYPSAATRWRGIAPRRAYLVNLSNNFPPMLAAGGRAGYRAPPMV